jgi:hypothetical protein
MKNIIIVIAAVAALWGCGPSPAGNPLDRVYNPKTLDQDDCDILQYAIDVGARDSIYERLHDYCYDEFYREHLPTVEPVPSYRSLLGWAERHREYLESGIQLEYLGYEYDLYGPNQDDSLRVFYDFCIHNRTGRAIKELSMAITLKDDSDGEVTRLYTRYSDLKADQSMDVRWGWSDLRKGDPWYRNVLSRKVGYYSCFTRIDFDENEVAERYWGGREMVFGLDGAFLR